MLNAVSHARDRKLLKPLNHRRAVFQVWRCVTSSWGSAPEANRASSRLSRTNSALWRCSDVDISSKSCIVDAVWDAECCITSSWSFRSSCSLTCCVNLVSTGHPRGNHGWRFTARCKLKIFENVENRLVFKQILHRRGCLTWWMLCDVIVIVDSFRK